MMKIQISERGLALIFLPFPFVMGLFMYLFMREPDALNLVEPYVYTNFFIYSYSGLCLFYLPAFIVGYLWFLFKSKSHKDFIGKPLFQMPLVISVAMLYSIVPITMIHNIDLLKGFYSVGLIFLLSLMVSYLWIGLVKCLSAIMYNSLHLSGK